MMLNFLFLYKFFMHFTISVLSQARRLVSLLFLNGYRVQGGEPKMFNIELPNQYFSNQPLQAAGRDCWRGMKRVGWGHLNFFRRP